MKAIVGIIRSATFYGCKTLGRSPCIRGMIYADTKGRFVNGERITTSRIMAMHHIDGQLVVETTYSAYIVEFVPAEPDRLPALLGAHDKVGRT